MWRDKMEDIDLIATFIDNLFTFKSLKEVRWERIDEEVQRANKPATPDEDWIIPPDEGETLQVLEKDSDYVRLKEQLSRAVPELKKIARFLHFDQHHDFDWLTFTTPLVGNDALEDALSMAKNLLKACEKKNYALGNIMEFFRN